MDDVDPFAVGSADQAIPGRILDVDEARARTLWRLLDQHVGRLDSRTGGIGIELSLQLAPENRVRAVQADRKPVVDQPT